MRATLDTVRLVDSADTAIRAAGVLHLLKGSREVPPFAPTAVSQAIEILDDALCGSAVLTGCGDARGFAGSFSSLCWATDSFVAQRLNRNVAPEPSEVAAQLARVRGQMILVRDFLSKCTNQKLSEDDIRDAVGFFDAFASVLAERASAMLTHPQMSESSTPDE